MTKSLVSVVMIVYNAGEYIASAILSYKQQTYPSKELIIIDDASTDNTAEIVKHYSSADKSIRYYHNSERQGIVVARNLSLGFCQGKYVAVLDGDDKWLDNNKIGKQVKFLENNPEYAVVGGGVVVINDQGQEVKRYLNLAEDIKIRKRILSKNQFVHSSVMFRRNAVQAVQGYHDFKIGEDYELYLRLGKIYKFANISEYLVAYRIHSGNTTKNIFQALCDNWRIVSLYKNDYPGYWRAFFRRLIRLITYKLYSILIK